MKKRRCSSLETVDRISDLPDPIRSHIVSFLPLQDAVRNTILSKGWKRICSSLTHLDFREFWKRSDLKDIIDRVLFFHVGRYIEKLELCVSARPDCVDPRHLNTWISFALRHNVVMLELDIGYGGIRMLPCSLFTSSTLVVLRLLQLNLKLPSKVHFPVLKTLELALITFHNEYLTAKLFSDSCCPRLLNLKIINCLFDDFTTFSVSSTSLSSLKLGGFDDDRALNINLSTPNLHEIDFHGTRLPAFSSEALSSLFVASFDLYFPPSTSEATGDLAYKTLARLHNVEKLSLTLYFPKSLARIQDLPEFLLPSCCSLKRMELGIKSTKHEMQLINFLFRCYPNLQALLIHFYDTPSKEDDSPQGLLSMKEYLQYKALSTRHILKNLTTVIIDNFRGRESEVDLIGYLLEHANILERMDIRCLHHKPKNVESGMRNSDTLLTLPRISPCARIHIA